MRKNPHDIILGEEPKEQPLSTVCKSCLLYIYIYIYIYIYHAQFSKRR